MNISTKQIAEVASVIADSYAWGWTVEVQEAIDGTAEVLDARAIPITDTVREYVAYLRERMALYDVEGDAWLQTDGPDWMGVAEEGEPPTIMDTGVAYGYLRAWADAWDVRVIDIVRVIDRCEAAECKEKPTHDVAWIGPHTGWRAQDGDRWCEAHAIAEAQRREDAEDEDREG